MGSMTTTEFLATLPEPFDLYNSHAKYGRYVSVKEVRQRIKEELAMAVTAGMLPPEFKASIRGDHNTVHVDVMAWPDGVFTSEYMEVVLDPLIEREGGALHERNWQVRNDETREFEDTRLVPELRAAITLIHQIVNRHNFDRSDIMTDYFHVGFYDHIGAGPVIAVALHALRLESDPALALKLRKARIACDVIGPKAAKAELPKRGGIDAAGDWTLDRLIKIAEKADGYELAYDKRRGWVKDTSKPRGPTFDERLRLNGIGTVVHAPAPVPACVTHMKCLCAGHARGNAASAPCDTAEVPPPAPVRATRQPAPPAPVKCHHNRTRDGGRMYVDPTVFCLECGAYRKMASTRWSDEQEVAA